MAYGASKNAPGEIPLQRLVASSFAGDRKLISTFPCRMHIAPMRERHASLMIVNARRNWRSPLCFDRGVNPPRPLRPEVRGVELDAETRCVHYHSALDIIAIKTACCGVYYACKDCHAALANHDIKVWPRSEWDVRAILCGVCGSELTIREYMSSNYSCPRCAAGFNPGCRNHHRFYFGPEESA
jgi:uncharacterized CHY-type Zn-finger protein